MIEFKSVTKKYGDKVVFTDFDLEIKDGEITAILGENGSGKTTLLKMLAGITDYEGKISVGDRAAFVFQEDRLIKNLTVERNILLVAPTADATALLNEYGLSGYGKRYIKELSGGERRKVAIIRALAVSSPLLIMDEPFSSVDVATKQKFMGKILKERENKKNTVVIITHDIFEASDFADRIVVLSGGKIAFDKRDFDRVGIREEIYSLLSKRR
ncbi:MAG: ABC transporter ATP-binding protein [Clostridia bacterium]|nr:ABC transporter ATP-binding protein [Clostridia bacterium]